MERDGDRVSKRPYASLWFERQVSLSPGVCALSFEKTHLTYDELNRRANQVAHHLKELGVGPDVLVALFVERSLDMVVGILGILKAGGAYLPIDPIYPMERRAFMLEDADASVVLTQSALAKELPKGRIKIVCLDSDRELFEQKSDANPRVE